ncbi:MAG: DsbA family oxidoreductase [Thermomicrobiales bacterium]|nr:DsbA family oxidoreductase [Thermomicrobiales bacterium]
MLIEVWSDITCPWCYISKRRLETALTQFDGRDDVTVEWKSFQLDPSAPLGQTGTVYEALSKKFGKSVDEIKAMNQHVTELAAAEGLAYDFDKYQPINTFDAHRVLHLAKSLGIGDAVKERFLKGQFTEGERLEDHDTLVRLAAEAGVPEADARRVLSGTEYADAVRSDVRELQSLGGNGVPFFVVDRRYGISGAQPVEVFLNTLKAAQADATAGVS